MNAETIEAIAGLKAVVMHVYYGFIHLKNECLALLLELSTVQLKPLNQLYLGLGSAKVDA
jgi:hypothetical protein